jgi:hypothetical protein
MNMTFTHTQFWFRPTQPSGGDIIIRMRKKLS